MKQLIVGRPTIKSCTCETLHVIPFYQHSTSDHICVMCSHFIISIICLKLIISCRHLQYSYYLKIVYVFDTQLNISSNMVYTGSRIVGQ